jgi:hypothetical protein
MLMRARLVVLIVGLLVACRSDSAVPLAPSFEVSDASITTSPDAGEIPTPVLVACGAHPHGTVETRTRYASPHVQPGEPCRAELQSRSCHDGRWSSWSGHFGALTCEARAFRACDDVEHGGHQLRERYETASVAFGESCQVEPQLRTCHDGVWSAWSGAFEHESCSPRTPAACGDTPHGGSEQRVRFREALVAWNAACEAETQSRACFDGVWSSWSGRHDVESCEVATPRPCAGAPHEAVEMRTRYREERPPDDQACATEEQSRQCVDGAWTGWSGTFAAAECVSCRDDDLDRDGYGPHCVRGPDCGPGDATIHPGAPEFPWDLVDSDCDGHRGGHLEVEAQVGFSYPYDETLLLDGDRLASVGSYFTLYAVDDLQAPVRRTTINTYRPGRAQLRGNVLVLRSVSDDDLVVYDVNEVGRGYRALMYTAQQAPFSLSADGARLAVNHFGPRVVVYDLSQPDSEPLLHVWETPCRRSTLQWAGDLLVEADCVDTAELTPFDLRVYDLAGAQPVLHARRTARAGEVFVGATPEHVYLRRGRLVVRHELLGFDSDADADGDGLGDAEELRLPSEPGGNVRAMAVSEAGLWYVDGGGQLCRFAPAAVNASCTQLLQPAEADATHHIEADGSKLLLVGIESARVVDVAEVERPRAVGRLIQPVAPELTHFDDERLLLETWTGVASYDPRTLAPLDLLSVPGGAACATQHGDRTYLIDNEGVLHVLELDGAGRIVERSSSPWLHEHVSKCLVATRGAQRYLVAASEQQLFAAALSREDLPAMPLLLYEQSKILGLADTGEELLVSVHVDVLEGPSWVLALRSLEVAEGPELLAESDASRVLHGWVFDGSAFISGDGLMRLDLASGEVWSDPHVPALGGLCIAGDELFGVERSGLGFGTVRDTGYREAGLDGLDPRLGHLRYRCAGTREHLLLSAPGQLVLTRLVPSGD